MELPLLAVAVVVVQLRQRCESEVEDKTWPVLPLESLQIWSETLELQAFASCVRETAGGLLSLKLRHFSGREVVVGTVPERT